MTSYIIKYTTIEGEDGQTTHGFIDYDYTNKYADLLNIKHPNVKHYVELSPKGTPLASIRDYSLDNLPKELT